VQREARLKESEGENRESTKRETEKQSIRARSVMKSGDRGWKSSLPMKPSKGISYKGKPKTINI
jgi:hypothetical protein